jgi:hypothetical protein
MVLDFNGVAEEHGGLKNTSKLKSFGSSQNIISMLQQFSADFGRSRVTRLSEGLGKKWKSDQLLPDALCQVSKLKS